MGAITIELVTFVAIFSAACAALTAFIRNAVASRTLLRSRRKLNLVRQYSPAVDVMMEYRDAHAFRTLRRVRISKVLRSRAGRLYLLGFYEVASKPRTFRLDRVICFVSLDGEVIDTQRFVLERLRIPAP